jgi:galactitol-specific phosphotransferase system IIB component
MEIKNNDVNDVNSDDSNNTENLERELLNVNYKKKLQLENIVLSSEQNQIINSESNILADCTAGSGKSTVILHFAKKYPSKRMVQITYNNMLKHEIRKKVNILEISNLIVHTYHSLAVNFYEPSAYTDEEIKKILSKNTPCKYNLKFDVLLIDETQDMMIDYFLLIKKFISDTKSNPQILIFGDKHQGIYEFKGANTKFLTLASRVWNLNFKNLTLSTSFRMTNQIAWFVNNCMLNCTLTNPRINTIKTGPNVDYYICNSYQIYETIGNQIITMIKRKEIKEEDIFILSPSIKSENPYKKLENYLVSHGLKCMTPISDDAKLDDKIISNKIVFTTYHQAKGRERKLVILYSFDDSYFKYYLRDSDPKECPNILYVGATRAMYKLILIHDSKYPALQFLNFNVGSIQKYVNIHNIDSIKLNFNKPNTQEHKTTVTDLIKFIDSQIMDDIIMLTDDLFIKLVPPNNIVNVPCKIKNIDTQTNKESYEDVSDLNGLVIPAIYERLICGSSTIETFVKENTNKNFYNGIKKYIRKITIPCVKVSDFLKVGNIYLSLHNKLHSKLAQIKKYNWLDKKMIGGCHKNMKILENKKLTFEKTICSKNSDIFEFVHKEYGLIKIAGRIDAFDENTVYEFKCVDSISIDHKLQIILYCWLWKNSSLNIEYGAKNFVILNIKTGELIKLSDNYFIISQVVELILANKFVKKISLGDNEFINQIHKLVDKFIKK